MLRMFIKKGLAAIVCFDEQSSRILRWIWTSKLVLEIFWTSMCYSEKQWIPIHCRVV